MDVHTYRWMDGWMDGWTYRFPLYSTGLCFLWFPPEPLPCSHNCHHYKIPEQGKGTDDHLLPLGDWLCLNQGCGSRGGSAASAFMGGIAINNGSGTEIHFFCIPGWNIILCLKVLLPETKINDMAIGISVLLVLDYFTCD